MQLHRVGLESLKMRYIGFECHVDKLCIKAKMKYFYIRY